jgi:hypothetical protein
MLVKPQSQSQSQLAGYINTTVKEGGLVVKVKDGKRNKEVSLLEYLLSQDLIDQNTFNEFKDDQSITVQMTPWTIKLEAYDYKGETKESLKLLGSTVIGDKTYGLSIQAGYTTVAATHLLTQLLMLGSLEREIQITVYPHRKVQNASGVKVTFADGSPSEGYSFDDLKGQDRTVLFDMLKADNPSKVSAYNEEPLVEEEEDLPVEETVL